MVKRRGLGSVPGQLNRTPASQSTLIHLNNFLIKDRPVLSILSKFLHGENMFCWQSQFGLGVHSCRRENNFPDNERLNEEQAGLDLAGAGTAGLPTGKYFHEGPK